MLYNPYGSPSPYGKCHQDKLMKKKKKQQFNFKLCFVLYQ